MTKFRPQKLTHLRPLFISLFISGRNFAVEQTAAEFFKNSSQNFAFVYCEMITLTAELTLVACFPSETNAELPFLALSSTEQGQLFLVDQHTGQ